MKTYRDFEEYLDNLAAIHHQNPFPGEKGLLRVKYFLSQLGDIQEKLKVIHIAGTSGKGSTAMILSSLLIDQDFKVGLFLSPHLIDVRERFQIQNKLLSPEIIAKYFDQIFPKLEQMKLTEYGGLSYFEMITVFSFYIFQKEQVDYVVLETGLGGLLDATNCITNPHKVAVITKLGLDHMHILGDTINKIADQKLGIIQPKNTVFIGFQDSRVYPILESKLKDTPNKYFASKDIQINEKKVGIEGSEFDISFLNVGIKDLKLRVLGEFQVQNCALSLGVMIYLSQRDNFQIIQKKVKQTLQTMHIPGRFEVLKIGGKTIVLDGAHNPQKMESFLSSLKDIYPKATISFLIAIKKSKDYKDIISQFKTLKNAEFILSSFGESAANPHDLKKAFEDIGQPMTTLIPDLKIAFSKLLKQSSDILVITGSFYTVAEIYHIINKR